ncbi:hypothetical protein X777_10111 [Ooceraea biroi]|uniref:Uncharacterized protein n=1 Tax=Ooceraea biroi TaxID=2015173 RepID=A0A026X388_OOCBI|nr:hypothetical protein X777_10111 [Ooceraea biroi]
MRKRLSVRAKNRRREKRAREKEKETTSEGGDVRNTKEEKRDQAKVETKAPTKYRRRTFSDRETGRGEIQ